MKKVLLFLLILSLSGCGFMGFQYNAKFKTDSYQKYISTAREGDKQILTDCGSQFYLGFIIPIPVWQFNKCTQQMNTYIPYNNVSKAILVYGNNTHIAFSSYAGYVAFKDINIEELKQSKDAKIIITEKDGTIVELPFEWKMMFRVVPLNS